jgi:hypothetical protein
MTKVTQIDDRSATVAWSPIGSHADVIALGAKVSLRKVIPKMFFKLKIDGDFSNNALFLSLSFVPCKTKHMHTQYYV